MTLKALFTSIADAIREKNDTTDKIKATDFAEEIKNIQTAEDLDTELNAQDEVLIVQDDKINEIFSALENVGKNNFNIEVDFSKTVTAGPGVFAQAIKEIGYIDTSKLTSARYMFYDYKSLEKITLFDTSLVTNMEAMFSRLLKIKSSSYICYY